MGVRLMQLTDFPQLGQLWEMEHMESGLEYLKAVLSRNPETCFVYEINGRIVSAACGLYDGRRGVLQSVATLPEERGKGYATTVIQAVIQALQTLGTNRIRLFVYKDNQPALDLYHKLGFKILDDTYYMGLEG